MEVGIDRNEIWPAFSVQRYSGEEPSAGKIYMSELEIEDFKRVEDEWYRWQEIVSERLRQSGGKWA